MSYCPDCGYENVPGAKHCWECQQPLEAKSLRNHDLEDEWLEDDGDLENEVHNASGSNSVDPLSATMSEQQTAEAVAIENSTVDLKGHVVAFVAQDEVQAGTISQLLTDCGIQNVANVQEEDNEESYLEVHVPKEDLATARSIIDDFTSMFEEREALREEREGEV